MEDKDVGELWRDHMRHNQDPRYYCEQCELIRKLVEERVCRLGNKRDLAQALREFGIDPKSFNRGAG